MLLVIGLDGADWAILNPWLERGELPHLAALRARAAWGPLRSTIRPESSVAWSSFATGVNAGRHGIYSFSAQQPQSYQTWLNTAAAIRFPTFWQRAGSAGKRVALLNVPMTYPPQAFPEGVIVGGMLTPSLRSDFTQPPRLREALLTAVPDYVIDVERTGLSLQRFIRETTRAIIARGQAARWLLQQQAWDAFVVVFTDTDRLQHYTLHLLAPDHPRHNPTASAALLPDLLAAYRAIDAAIGDLVAAAGPEATVLILSDHGFAPCARSFAPNTWLETRGLLARVPGSQPHPPLWQRLRQRPALRRLKNSLPIVRDWRRQPAPGGSLASVDWNRTAAVYSPAGGIRFNIRGREPQGILSKDEATALAGDMTTDLLALTNPTTGDHPIAAIYPRETLYHGPYLDLAPDLILEPRRDSSNPGHNTTLFYGFTASPFTDSGDLTGNHALDGILMAAGPGISPGPIADAGLIDIAPTILHALDLALPPDLDGHPLPLWASPRPLRWQETDSELPAPDDAPTFDVAEQTTIEDRLRALGYL